MCFNFIEIEFFSNKREEEKDSSRFQLETLELKKAQLLVTDKIIYAW